MHPGLQQFSHADDGHGGVASLSVRCSYSRRARLEPGSVSIRHRHPSRPRRIDGGSGHSSGDPVESRLSFEGGDHAQRAGRRDPRGLVGARARGRRRGASRRRRAVAPPPRPVGQVGDVPTFIVELSRELAEPQPGRLRRGGPLAALVRDHAREREALGFAPREIVTELLILRRVLWRFVSKRASSLTGQEVLEAERRLNDSLDVLVAECVVAYFDRATAELARPRTPRRAHGAAEPRRVRRGGRRRALPRAALRARAHARLLRRRRLQADQRHARPSRGRPRAAACVVDPRPVAARVRRRRSHGRGRVLGVRSIESDVETGGRFLARFHDLIDEAAAGGRLPERFSVSAGLASYPQDAVAADALFRLADGGSTRRSARSWSTRRRARARPGDPPASGEVTSTRSSVNGCWKARRAAWRNCRSRPRSPPTP